MKKVIAVLILLLVIVGIILMSIYVSPYAVSFIALVALFAPILLFAAWE